MVFTYPAFFIALGALAIPVIIHLFNLRRYKKVYFTNVRLLQDIQFETKAQSKLRHWLILLCRLLALFLLVAAFTMPFLPSENRQAADLSTREIISIYIDNSFSMSARDDEKELLQKAKQQALNIVKAYDGDVQFQVLSNDFKSSHQHLYRKDAVNDLIEDIAISPNFRTLSAVINRQKDLLNTYGDVKKTAFLLSDFQESMFDHDEISNDSSITFNLLPVVAANPGNLFIDSCWFSSPIRQYGQQETVNVRIRNLSDNDYNNIPLKLYINDQQKTPATVNIDAHSTTEVALKYTNNSYGDQAGKIVLRDYPVTFDDVFYFNYQIDSLIRILTINGGNESPALAALFRNEGGFNLTNQSESNIDFGSFSTYNVIVLNGVKAPSSGLLQGLQNFTETGGNIVIFPSSDPDREAYRELFSALKLPLPGSADSAKTSVNRINRQSELYSGVFREIPANLNLPVVLKHFPFSGTGFRDSEELLSMENGRFFLKKFPHHSGTVYLFAVPLDDKFSNFSKHSIFVPTLYNIALYSQSAQTLYYTIGLNSVVTVQHPAGDEPIYHLTGEETDVIPELRITENAHLLHFHNQVTRDGNYVLKMGNRDESLGVAFNFDRNESNLASYDAGSMNDIINKSGWTNFHLYDGNNAQNFASLINFIHHGKPLWKYCLILVLVFLGIEILLTKLWK